MIFQPTKLLKIKNLGALTQAAVLPESLLHAMLQRLGEMIPVSVAMAVNLKNAVVKIYSALLIEPTRNTHSGILEEFKA